MPLYEYICECGCEVEKVQIGIEPPTCLKCGGVMRYRFSPIAMVKMKGMGGYPSLRKAHQAGGRDLVPDKERARAEENRAREFIDQARPMWV